MKSLLTCSGELYSCVFLLCLLAASCDQPKKSDAAVQHSDSLSVKKMDDKSNSDMPMGVSKDSTVEIPNAYKPETKAQ